MTLVLKKKDNAGGSVRFKSHNSTLGIVMVPGVGFTGKLSPATTCESLKLKLILILRSARKVREYEVVS